MRVPFVFENVGDSKILSCRLFSKRGSRKSVRCNHAAYEPLGSWCFVVICLVVK